MSDALESSPYAGRWVARLEGRIVAHGGTPEQARLAAQKGHFKERLEIDYVQPAALLPLSPLVERVRLALPDQEIYLVGGAVRDALLGKTSHDLDFAVPRNAIPLARRVADALRGDFYILDESFDTARVIVRAISPGELALTQGATMEPPAGRDFLDFASYRSAKGPSGSATHRPETLEADLRGRDFTVNAMAYDVRNGTILDPFAGAADLRARIIRAVTNTALEDDPIRILRGVRLAAALDFKIDPSTRRAMKASAHLLPAISPERQRDELFRMLDGPRPDASLRAVEMLGVFPYLLPELAAMKGVGQSAPHVADVWEHTLGVIRQLDDILAALALSRSAEDNGDLFTGMLSLRLGRYREQFAQHFAMALNPDRSLRALLFLAALYHDVAKPATKTVEASGRIRFFGHDADGAEAAARRGRAFNLSNGEVERLQRIIANHMRFHFHVNRLEVEGKQPSRRAIYRFFRDSGSAGVDLVLLGLADLRGTRGHLLTEATWASGLEIARLFLENYWEKPEESISPPRLLNGNELMHEMELSPGPVVGQLLNAIEEAQAMGQLGSRDQAITFAREWLAAKGGRPAEDATGSSR
ncbi:MAG TPA: HD domain-containing protein [Anaerolineales bacterium]|nr:HD domain-containing protein [Anaerolineales bacterium]